MICFITPPSAFLLDERVFVNLGVLKVAAACIARGHEVEHVDLDGVTNFEDAVATHAAQTSAQTFALTATTPQMPATARIVAAIRRSRPDAKIILGGPHATLTAAAVKLEVKRGTQGRARRALAQLRDLAKFGLLVARRGVWDGRRIVSEEWLRDSTRPHVRSSDYAYHWWATTLSGFPIAAATGYGGQAVYASPDLDLVVVMTTRSDQANVPQSYYDETGLIMTRYILPSIRTQPPALDPGGVVNAADYTLGLAAGSFASAFGANLGLVTAGWDAAMPSYGALPEGVGGVTVRIGGRPAHPSYASPRQVNFLVPGDLPPGRYPVEIVTPRTSVIQEVDVTELAPSLFILAVREDGKRMAALQAVEPGQPVELWASGLGPSDPPLDPGAVLDHPRPLRYQPEVTVGGRPAEITYAGLAFAGVWQVNIRVPEGLTPGLAAVELRVGPAVSRSEINLEIR